MTEKRPEPPRRHRYQRASTLSVTQLLTDSCSSLLQKLTTKVRGPSQTSEQVLRSIPQQPQPPPKPLSKSTSTTSIPNSRVSTATNTETSLLGSTRSRLEDKYSAVLEKLGKRKDHEKTLEPSTSKSKPGNALSKSATSVMLSEKAYPYVTALPREKTPYRSSAHRLHHQNHFPEPPYAYLDHHSAYHHLKSTHNELRPRRSSKPIRKGENFKLCPVEIPVDDFHDETTPTNELDPQMIEREAKRKEIQSLIMKYSALDEAYNKATSKSAVPIPVEQPPPPPPHSVKIAHKYATKKALTVSSQSVVGEMANETTCRPLTCVPLCVVF